MENYIKKLNDIIIFFKKYYIDFIFKQSDTIDEKLDKIIMFVIYLTTLFYFISSPFMTLSLIILIFLIFIKLTYNKKEFFNFKNCRKPTIDNPFMNPLLVQDGLEACDVSEDEKLNKYYHNLKRNTKDVFEKNTGQIYYQTNNVTTVPNKYKDFLNFIGMTYNEKDNNCKYDGLNCRIVQDFKYR
jgi:hypothetical protein